MSYKGWNPLFEEKDTIGVWRSMLMKRNKKTIIH
jgi:hypothetical protein